MANEIRLRINNVGGVITDNPLTIGATTINSPGFADLPTVDATSHLVLILDPQEVGGPAEIVRVTAHTAASTSCTVLRGQEGSLARSHVFNTTWFHGPVESDYVDIFTSSTRPAWAYEGMFGYETDTNKLIGFGGTDWAPRDAGGQLGAVSVTAGQSSAAQITVASLAVTVGTGRRVRVSGMIRQHTHSVVNGRTLLQVFEDGVERSSVLVIGHPTVAGNATMGGTVWWIGTPTAGSRTYSFRMTQADAGTVSYAADPTFPAFLLVEDIGAA